MHAGCNMYHSREDCRDRAKAQLVRLTPCYASNAFFHLAPVLYYYHPSYWLVSAPSHNPVNMERLFLVLKEPCLLRNYTVRIVSNGKVSAQWKATSMKRKN